MRNQIGLMSIQLIICALRFPPQSFIKDLNIHSDARLNRRTDRSQHGSHYI